MIVLNIYVCSFRNNCFNIHKWLFLAFISVVSLSLILKSDVSLSFVLTFVALTLAVMLGIHTYTRSYKFSIMD